MNNVSLYLKAHIMRSSVAAVDLAKRNPSLKNIHFAEKILEIKLTDAPFKLNGDASNGTVKQDGVNKYQLLFNRLSEIKINCIDKYEFKSNENKEKNTRFFKALSFLNNFKNKDFSNKNLIGINFKNKDLRTTNFSFSYILNKEDENKGVDFSGSNLSNVDLSVAHLNGSKFINSDLTGAKVNLNNADYSNAKLDGAEISFNPYLPLDRYTLDECFSDSTLFHTIDSIDDKYYSIKTSLMGQIINKLSLFSEDKLKELPLDLIIDKVLSKDYYLKDNDIWAFTKLLFENKIKDDTSDKVKVFSDKLLKSNFDFCLDMASSLHKNFMIERNGEFIELMSRSLYHDNKNIQEKARALYGEYLNLDEVKPFIEKEDFGNGNKEADWSEKDYYNYILLDKNKAMIINHENLTSMLFPRDTKSDISWNNFFLYINNENQAVSRIDYYKLFNNDFKIFKESFNENFSNIRSHRILKLLDLGDFHKRFNSTFLGNPIDNRQKIVDFDIQEKLTKKFEKVIIISDINIKNTSLREEHYQEICQSLNIESLNNEEKSKYLLSLAILFVKYSSSDVFGTGDDSPQILRMYAYALMSKANELNPDLIKNTFNDWENRLLGKNDAFTCTDTLFLIMSSYGKKHFNHIYSDIMPPHWR
ncbi:pentapeptide repeat-containing protein [Proteus hauseri]|uniref:pentapeptide repeat-containing protein n=1 Tax=Proteus hauseri TaxID=183417 RepID=UPI0032D9B1B7